MIELVCDEALNIGEFEMLSRGVRYRYKIRAGDRFLCSKWRVLSASNPQMISAANRYFEVAESWSSYLKTSTGRDYLEARKLSCDGPISFDGYPTYKADQLQNVHGIYQSYVRERTALCSLVEAEDDFETFCALEDEKSRAKYFVYRRGKVWSSKRSLSPEEWIRLIDYKTAREDAALSVALKGGELNSGEMRTISVEVRREVWRRDNGKCTNCGSRDRLEFDHIIPVALGGSNTVRNIQLLCEWCNRQKSATLG